ncbi:hypothetical protein TSUD_110500, partial [Trifolium subterraneum]
MGVCLSAQIKAESPYNTGLNSKNSNSTGNDLSSTNSKVSAGSVPQTPRSEGGSYFQPLSWSLRLKVALDAAKGLAFLHSSETKVIYRDFKTSNILLDSDYNAKLSDFGLAKDGPTGDKSHVSTRVMGTYGYAAPEYLATDSRLEGQYSSDESYRVATLALRCLSTESKYRPNMDEVVRILEQLKVPNVNVGNQRRYRRKSADDVTHAKTHTKSCTSVRAHTSYPRPSASPLYA